MFNIFEKIKNFFFKRQKLDIPISSLGFSSILYQSKVFDIKLFDSYNQNIKDNTFWDMYKSSGIINSAVNLFLSGIMRQNFVYVNNKDLELSEAINTFLKTSNFFVKLETIFRNFIVQGYVLGYIYYEDMDLKIQHIPLSSIEEEKENLIRIKDKFYSKENYIHVKDVHSMLLPILPYYNLIKLTEDSLFFNLAKFGFPLLKVITKNKLSEEKKNIIKQKLKDFFENKDYITTGIFFLEEEEVDLEIGKIDNIIPDYIETLRMYESLVYKVLGILPTLSTESGGSYAKAIVQESIFQYNIKRITKIILDELNRKYIPKLEAIFKGDFEYNKGILEVLVDEQG